MNWEPYLQIRRVALESIDELRRTRFRDVLAPELAKYERFFQELVPFLEEQLGKNTTTRVEERMYEHMKDLYRRLEIEKAIHFPNYNNYKRPTLFVIENIILESIRLLATCIELHEAGRERYRDGFQRRWIDSYNERIEGVVNTFSQNLPCSEGYVSSLQNIKLELEKGPPEEVEPPVIASVKMKPTNFTSDGDFKAVAESRVGLMDFQLIALSMHAFKKSLCGTIDNCEPGAAGEQPAILAAFNLDNYKLFLENIEFYGNDKYGTQGIPDFETLEELFDGYSLSFPSPDGWGNPPHCCQRHLISELRSIGGAQRRRKTRGKKHRRYKKKTRKSRGLKLQK